MDLSTAGARIRFAREQKGWTQEQLGEAVGVDRTHVSKWERDEVTPRGSTRLKVGQALGANYEWLRTGAGDWRAPESGQTEAFAPADFGDDDEGVTIALDFTANFMKTFDVQLSDQGKMALALFFAKMYIARKAKRVADIHYQNMGLFVSDMLKRIHTGEIK